MLSIAKRMSSGSVLAAADARRLTTHMSTLNERIRMARGRIGMSQVALANKVGVTRSAATQWEAEGGTEPSAENLRKIAEATGVHFEWLATGRGAVQTAEAARLVASFDPDTEDRDGERFGQGRGVSTDRPYQGELANASPVIDTTAGGGPGGLSLPAALPSGGVIYAEDAVLGEIVLPGYLTREFTRAPAARLHWIKVRGDSMEPSLRSGDHVGVDTTDRALGQGGIFVARTLDGEVIVKRLRRVPRSDPAMILVVSDNALEPDQEVPAEDLSVIGRVVARICRV